MSDVRLPLNVRLSDLKGVLSWKDGDVDPEMYVRIESGRAFLYAVKRLHGNGIGKMVWSREIPVLPGEDD